MPKNLISFKDYARQQPSRVAADNSATVIILPTVKVERFGEPSMTDPPFAAPPATSAPTRANRTKRLRAKLQEQAGTVEGALAWLARMAIEGAEPTAIAAVLGGAETDGHVDADFRLAAAWLHEFAIAWQREQRRNPA